MTTDVTLGAGMQADTLFVFARRRDSRLAYNLAPRGGGFFNWHY